MKTIKYLNTNNFVQILHVVRFIHTDYDLIIEIIKLKIVNLN